MTDDIVKSSLETLERHSNHLNDLDSEWWPFKHFKPKQDQRLSLSTTLFFAVLYGLPASLLGVVVGSLMGEAMQPADLVLFPGATVAATFLILYVSVTHFWNRRVTRLHRLEELRRQP